MCRFPRGCEWQPAIGLRVGHVPPSGILQPLLHSCHLRLLLANEGRPSIRSTVWPKLDESVCWITLLVARSKSAQFLQQRTGRFMRVFQVLSQNSCEKRLSAFYMWVSVHHKSIIYNKPTRCKSGSIVFIKNYKYALHVSDALCVHLQEHSL